MRQQTIYITVNHLDDYNSTYMFKPGDVLTLKKKYDNFYQLKTEKKKDDMPKSILMSSLFIGNMDGISRRTMIK